eukprot:TRINITY_DN13674_c0_g3_i1.p1 TRINITY_DN13674_c0_g3~~TRINITY_DN13674_c0_g3_i1.p1  ORF type:complete len:119 (-),score=15.33 TRINITY_DN13674_c0_g3_i1:206-562(-)
MFCTITFLRASFILSNALKLLNEISKIAASSMGNFTKSVVNEKKVLLLNRFKPLADVTNTLAPSFASSFHEMTFPVNIQHTSDHYRRHSRQTVHSKLLIFSLNGIKIAEAAKKGHSGC